MRAGFPARGRPLLIGGAALAGVVLVRVADPTTPGGMIPACPSKTLFGLCCPVCGASRMVYHLSHGDISQAVHMNALLMLALVLLVYTGIAWACRRRGLALPSIERWDAWPWFALTAFIGWLIVRNLPFAPFTALWV